jgi:hypothetical protein
MSQDADLAAELDDALAFVSEVVNGIHEPDFVLYAPQLPIQALAFAAVQAAVDEVPSTDLSATESKITAQLDLLRDEMCREEVPIAALRGLASLPSWRIVRTLVLRNALDKKLDTAEFLKASDLHRLEVIGGSFTHELHEAIVQLSRNGTLSALGLYPDDESLVQSQLQAGTVPQIRDLQVPSIDCLKLFDTSRLEGVACEVTTHGVRLLNAAGLARLRRLRLFIAGDPQEVIDALVVSEHLQDSVRELHLDLCQEPSSITRLLSAWEGLVRFTLNGPVTVSALPPSGTQLGHLRRLSIQSRLLGDQGWEVITSWGLPELESLSLAGTNAGMRGLTALCSGSSIARLQALDLSENRIDSAGWPMLVALARRSALKSLNVGNNPLSSDVALPRNLVNGTIPLRSLSLGSVNAPQLVPLIQNGCLSELRALSATVSNGVDALCSSLEHGEQSELLSLRLGIGVDDRCLASLASWTGLSRLKQLALVGDITQYGLAVLLGCENCRLRELDLSHSPLGDAGAEHIARSVVVSRLVSLGLIGCRVSPTGIKQLAQSQHLRRLRHLRMLPGQLQVFSESVIDPALTRRRLIGFAAN